MAISPTKLLSKKEAPNLARVARAEGFIDEILLKIPVVQGSRYSFNLTQLLSSESCAIPIYDEPGTAPISAVDASELVRRFKEAGWNDVAYHEPVLSLTCPVYSLMSEPRVSFDEALDLYLKEHLSIHIKTEMGCYGSGSRIIFELKLKGEPISQDWIDVQELRSLL